jgi:hypothetical protein
VPKTFLTLPSGILSHDTFNRAFATLDPEEMEKGFVAWVSSIAKLPGARGRSCLQTRTQTAHRCGGGQAVRGNFTVSRWWEVLVSNTTLSGFTS